MAKKKRKRLSAAEEQVLFSMERTVLSKERTVLSFMQTGLAFIGVGIVLINVFSGSQTSLIVGTALVLIGFVEVLESLRRITKYQKKMKSIKEKLGDDEV
jgi:uncharacterized membrane protein YidH (DUF202 family)